MLCFKTSWHSLSIFGCMLGLYKCLLWHPPPIFGQADATSARESVTRAVPAIAITHPYSKEIGPPSVHASRKLPSTKTYTHGKQDTEKPWSWNWLRQRSRERWFTWQAAGPWHEPIPPQGSSSLLSIASAEMQRPRMSVQCKNTKPACWADEMKQ